MDNIYSPEFIPFYIKDIKELKLTPLEWLAYWFIRFYWKNNKFFFSSKDFANIIWTTEKTINNIIAKFVKLWIIKTNTQRFNNNWVINSIREVIFCYNQVILLSPTSDNTISLPSDIKENNKDNKKNINIQKDILLEYKDNKIMRLLIKIISEWKIKQKIENKEAIDIYEYIILKWKEYLIDDKWELRKKDLEIKIESYYNRCLEPKKPISNIKSSIFNFITSKYGK